MLFEKVTLVAVVPPKDTLPLNVLEIILVVVTVVLLIDTLLLNVLEVRMRLVAEDPLNTTAPLNVLEELMLTLLVPENVTALKSPPTLLMLIVPGEPEKSKVLYVYPYPKKEQLPLVKVICPVVGVNVAPLVIVRGELLLIVVTADPIFRVPPDATENDSALQTDPISTVPPVKTFKLPKDVCDEFAFITAPEFTVVVPVRAI